VVKRKAASRQSLIERQVFLIDTNVVSELRRVRPHKAVLSWINDTDRRLLFLSAVSVGEIQKGIELTRPPDPQRAEELEAWLSALVSSWQVLFMDATIFRQWARLMMGKSDALYEDAMIAATALVHELTVVTRDTADFQPFAIELLNPFSYRG
jgi:toxin FitB